MSLIDRLSNLFRSRDINREIDEELEFHLEARVADNIASGMRADEARRDALLRFGGAAATREETRDADVVVAVDTLRQDLAIAARSLHRRPGFPAIVIATLALGIGAATTIFTLVESLLLRPLPFSEPERIYSLSHFSRDRPFWLMPGLPDWEYLALQEANLPFASTATFARASVTLIGAGDATRLTGASVTPDFFRVLGVNPALGRALAEGDAVPNAEPVVLLSDGLWRDKFGADQTWVNRTIQLDGTAHTVIGVLPPGFNYPDRSAFWTPLDVRPTHNLSFTRPTIARLKADATPATARAAFEAFAVNQQRGSQLAAEFVPLRESLVGDIKTTLFVFAGAMACLLLIACANVTNLLLVRSISRGQEIATRRALGASRGRIVRQLLTESTLLSLLAGVAGVGLAFLAIPAVLSLIPKGRLPRAEEIHVDGWVLAFTLGVSLVASVVVGLAPALCATRGRLASVIKEGPAASSPASHRLRHMLVVADVGLALVLLIGAGLLGQSFLKLQGIDPGFQPDAVMTMSVSLPTTRYAAVPQVIEFHDRVLSSLQAQPGVSAAGLVNWLPFGNITMRGDITAQGGQPLPPGFLPVKAAVSADYFKAMGLRLQTGRPFTSRDRAGSEGVAVISASVARTLWPGEEPLGRRISTETHPRPQDWLTVVGVVDDVKQNGLRAQADPAIYLPYSQITRLGWLGFVTYVARATSGQAASLATGMRGVVKSVDPNLAPESLAAMSDLVGTTIAEPRFQAKLIGALSFVAVVLAAIGIYGVLAASVFERRREIGIRMALGAARSMVVAMMLKRAFILALAGVTAGVVAAYALTGILTRFLFGVAPTDILTFVWASAVLFVVALLAGLLPARRASRLDPITTLRGD
jgi:putative ABC transport system permease protein